jgi:hypothetical protein
MPDVVTVQVQTGTARQHLANVYLFNYCVYLTTLSVPLAVKRQIPRCGRNHLGLISGYIQHVQENY